MSSRLNNPDPPSNDTTLQILQEQLAIQAAQLTEAIAVEKALRGRIDFLERSTWGAARLMQKILTLKDMLFPAGTRRARALSWCTRLLNTKKTVRFAPPFTPARLPHRQLNEIARTCMKPEYTTSDDIPLMSMLMLALDDQDPAAMAVTVQSFLDQIDARWEVLIGCTPKTEATWRQQHVAEEDARIRLIHISPEECTGAGWQLLLTAAQGTFVGVIDPGDTLEPHMLFEVATLQARQADVDLLYSDEDSFDGLLRFNAFFKPDWSPELMWTINYIGRLWLARRTVLLAAGGFHALETAAAEYDVLLRLSEQSRNIGHLRAPLYSHHFKNSPQMFPPHDSHTAEVLRDAIARTGIVAEVQPGLLPGSYRIRREIHGTPLVSIIIPTLGKMRYIPQCVASIRKISTYPRYEIIVVDNSRLPRCEAYDVLKEHGCTIVRWPEPFNWSQENNVGAAYANGEYLLFLNDDVEIVTPDWIEALLEHAQHPDIGVVGTKLIYPNRTVQHAGVFITGGIVAYGHAFRKYPHDHPGYYGLNNLERNCIAVTGACIMTSRRVYETLGGFDEELATTLNDVDYCLRAWEQGYRVVYTPYAMTCHHEMVSRAEVPMNQDTLRYWRRWFSVHQQGDPYYNPNLSTEREDYSYASHSAAYQTMWYWWLPNQTSMIDPIQITPLTPCGRYIAPRQKHSSLEHKG